MLLRQAPALKPGAHRRLRHDAPPGPQRGNDPGLARPLRARQGCDHRRKTWDFHVKVALGAELPENVEMIRSPSPISNQARRR